MFERPNWHRQAACRGMSPDAFFPDGEANGTNADYDAAKAVCANCPVTAECLAWAYENQERTGVWGGMTPLERKRHRKNVARQIRLGQQVLPS